MSGIPSTGPRFPTSAVVATNLDAALALCAQIQAGTWDDRYSLAPTGYTETDTRRARIAFASGYLESAVREAIRTLRSEVR